VGVGERGVRRRLAAPTCRGVHHVVVEQGEGVHQLERRAGVDHPVVGAVAAGADERDVAALGRYGECLGAAYQICDDLLDELGESATIGKNVGQDARHLRSTFTAQLGAEGAQRLALSLLAEGKQALQERFGECPTATLLIKAADLLISRAGPLRNATKNI
jgi:geranylgeranyl pyrophosphate synthase